MIPKYKTRSYILDKLQKGVVNFCMATTVLGFAFLVYRGYDYYRNIRPALKQMEFKAEEELLEEGKYMSATA